MGLFTINAVSIAEKMSIVMLSMALLYFAYLFIGGGLTGDEMKRVVVIIVLFFFATVFWAAFEQAPTSLNLFARDYTDRTIGGWEMPTLWLQSFNSLFVIALAPVFAALWTSLGRRNRDLSSPAKFAFGFCDGPPRMFGTRMRFFEVFGPRCTVIAVDDIKTDNNFARAVHEWAEANGREVRILGRAAMIVKKQEIPQQEAA